MGILEEALGKVKEAVGGNRFTTCLCGHNSLNRIVYPILKP